MPWALAALWLPPKAGHRSTLSMISSYAPNPELGNVLIFSPTSDQCNLLEKSALNQLAQGTIIPFCLEAELRFGCWLSRYAPSTFCTSGPAVP